MNPYLTEFKNALQKNIVLLKEDLKTIRTGRANPSIIEGLIVEAYGGQSKLKLMELASIINEDPTTLAINPYDPSTVQDIEKAFQKSPLGLNPQTQGTKIIVRLPPLSQEQRQKFVKLIGEKVEEKKNSMRNIRDEVRKKIKMSFEKKEITEDHRFRFEKEIDTETQNATASLQTIKESKERELMEV